MSFSTALAALFAVASLTSCVTPPPALPSAPAAQLDLSPQKTTLPSDRVALPTTEFGGMLLIEARLNGAGPFRLLVDTGAGPVVVSRRVAELAKIKPRRFAEGVLMNAVGGRVPARVADVDRLESGGFVLEKFGAFLADDADMAAFSTILKVDGVLGMNVLKDVVLELDFPGRQVVLHRPGTPDLPAGRGVSFTGMIPETTLDLAGQRVPVVIDSGFDGVLSLGSFEGLPLLSPQSKAQGAGAVFGQTTGARDYESQLDGEARLGPLTWVNPPLLGGIKSRSHGLVGVRALGRLRVVVDQQAKQAYFLGDAVQRTWEKQEPRDPRFTLGFFGQFEGTALRVVEVDPEGAADLAGLVPGDLILTLDGEPMLTATGAGSHRPQLLVLRDGHQFQTRLVVAPDYAPRQLRLAAERNPLPTTTVRGALLIEGRINGQGPYRFLVSTHAQGLALSPRVVAALNLKPMPGWQARPPGRGGPANTGPASNVVWIDTFTSGGLEMSGLVALALTPPAFTAMDGFFGPVDGAIGLEALQDAIIELDFPRKRVTAVKAGTGIYPAERAFAYAGGAPHLDVEFAGITKRLPLDTTASSGFVFRSLEGLPLSAKPRGLDAIAIGPIARPSRTLLDGDAKAGPLTWKQPSVVQANRSGIGLPGMASWRVVIDRPGRKVYFLDGGLVRTMDELAPGGAAFRPGYFARRDGEILRLVEVDAGGAFDRAGLRAGDVIVAIDGVLVPAYMREGGGAFNPSRNPQPLLRVRRDGKEFEARPILAPPPVTLP